MSWFRKKAKPDKAQDGRGRKAALSARPEKSAWVREEERPDGLIRLSYPLETKPWFSRLAKKLGKEESFTQMKMLDLDEMGTEVWGMIDGTASVQDLIDRFRKKYQLHPLEAETAMTGFIRQLGQRGLVGLKDLASGPDGEIEGGHAL